MKLVRPQEGTLLLFPSYFWHRTIPFDSAEQRISIAFDLILMMFPPLAKAR